MWPALDYTQPAALPEPRALGNDRPGKNGIGLISFRGHADRSLKTTQYIGRLDRCGILQIKQGRYESDTTRPGLFLQDGKITGVFIQTGESLAKVILDHGERNGFRPGDLDEVIKHFQEAARLSPGWANPHVGIGAALFRDGRFAEASQQLSRALDIDPHNVDALHVLGVLNGEQGQLTQAQDCLQRALKIDASRAEIHFALGQVFFEYFIC